MPKNNPLAVNIGPDVKLAHLSTTRTNYRSINIGAIKYAGGALPLTTKNLTLTDTGIGNSRG
jgi:hypothetical protein